MTFSSFLQAVIEGNVEAAARFLNAKPDFATKSFEARNEFFYKDIGHQVYQGDTALHVAAAAFQRASVELLIQSGAKLSVKNRRGAEPLHYAADANRWSPEAQSETIEYLLSVGANPNAADANGASPLHRAVRTRSAAAVRALLAGGADVHAMNKSGSTPYVLAIHDTGKGGSGSARAREQQGRILSLLLAAGARPASTRSTKRR
jgi:ankyrin repeat protein